MDDFEGDLKNNLYKIWNRLASGSYLPPPVLQVEIPKAAGGVRTLGIPTISDRIAQATIRAGLEKVCDPQFHEDSYGYRPKKSAHDALGVARRRCWRSNYVLDLDIKSYFDSIDHDLMMKAVRWFTSCKWTLLYVERWLKAESILEDGQRNPRSKGTPQGGVISPLLSNIFLHFVFDKWMEKNFPHIHFERYADDIIVHCSSIIQLETVKTSIATRMATCKLALNNEKTKVVYCRDSNRKNGWTGHVSFDFLGFRFMPRIARDKVGRFFVSFCPAISDKAAKNIRQTIKKNGV